MTSAERERVNAVRALGERPAPGQRLVPVGPLRQRAAVGHGARGLQRRWRRVGRTFPTTTPDRRAYRWGEDGMAGFSDVEQRLCLGLALWNGRDPILKERMFGLTGAQANHGEDVKEHWWYLDAVPSHAWNRWRYHYPQQPYPYDDLIAENGRRGKLDPEYELLDTGVFDDRLLDRGGRLRQGRSHRPADDGAGHQRRHRGGHGARAPHGVVPQHVGLGPRCRQARHAPRRRRVRHHRPPRPRGSRSWRRRRHPTARRRRRSSARTRRTPSGSTAPPTPRRIPKDGINDHVVSGRADGEPRWRGHEGRPSGTSSTSTPAPPWRCACGCGRPSPPAPSPPICSGRAMRRR